MEIPFMKKEGNETEQKDWRREALLIASAKIPFAVGTFKEIVSEIQVKYGTQISYDMVRIFLNKQGYKTQERPNRRKRKNNQNSYKMKDGWQKEGFLKAQKRMPLYRGDLKKLYNEMSEKYPELKYSSFANFLGKRGITTQEFSKKRTLENKGIKMQKQTNEFIGKIGSELGSTSYAIVKINGKKSIVSKPMPISNEEAMAIMEKRMF